MTTAELKIKEYQEDLKELETLLSQATRTNVKQFLSSQIEKLQSDLTRLQKTEQDRIARLNSSSASQQTIGYTKKIESYGWDESEKFVKIYITSLNDINKVKESDISCNFTAKSFDLTIKNLNNVNYNLAVINLLYNIDPNQSYVKCKTDAVAVFLRKVDTGRNWGYVTEKEAKTKEKVAPKIDENADPQEGLMSLMKKMYEEGDDEMKRTISKAFTESREKSLKGESLGMDI